MQVLFIICALASAIAAAELQTNTFSEIIDPNEDITSTIDVKIIYDALEKRAPIFEMTSLGAVSSAQPDHADPGLYAVATESSSAFPTIDLHLNDHEDSAKPADEYVQIQPRCCQLKRTSSAVQKEAVASGHVTSTTEKPAKESKTSTQSTGGAYKPGFASAILGLFAAYLV
ncbi:hypothetical protein METSCH_D08420 [Metschnikowia aff. pulcherrima]|uniref:Uncharacterized protein n=1 Tax=Metschnikowia aff. pulcherrima TaxID=2163413 RepID=A0A4P6XQR2_9ASCO|nr:hypothetical protein METSCH_D08420 [Metschnikowia aff. pulcherrima]